MKTIEFNLSEESINSAIQELRDWQEKLIKCENKVLKKLGEYAKERMKYYIDSSTQGTGKLSNSIQVEYSEHLARVFTDLFYASYVEYGTGIVGASNPHPKLADGWKYDTNSHGDKGWVYEDEEGNFWWTKGEVSHQFVYQTYQDLKEHYVELTMQVLREEGLV